MTGWQKEVDVLVVGSGAGGLVAAIAAADAHGDVLVIEKGKDYGGTSATSGGGIWIPNSHLAKAEGVEDSEDEAFRYVRSLSAPNVPDTVIRSYIQQAPKMLEWIEQNTPVRYASVPYPDYHVEYEGGKQGFRTHLPLPFDGRKLGNDVLTIQSASPAASLLGLINWKFDETQALLYRPRGWMKTLTGMVWRYATDLPHRIHSLKDRNLTLGSALVGGLRYALNTRNVPLWLNTSLENLICENGRVVGVEATKDGMPIRIGVRRGVILAAGGFERNEKMRKTYLEGSSDPTVSGSQVNNTGDAIRAAEKIGAALRNMQSTWSAPVFRVPGEKRARLSTVERALPGCIIVNQAGRRYLNEAASYHMVGRIMVEKDTPDAGTQPSWFIFDRTYRHKYPAGPVLPLIPDALQLPAVQKELKKASTPEELARQIGVPPQALAETLAAFNRGAEQGVDPEFGRGDAEYDKMYGDPRVTPNPCLAPIVKPPLYAYPIWSGDIGTNGGIVTDENARVLNTEESPIEGLYAVGNNAASVMGESYPGAGSTLGPAMTFGWLAGCHAMGSNMA